MIMYKIKSLYYKTFSRLTMLFAGMAFMLLLANRSTAQENLQNMSVTVIGTVVDIDKEPLEGVMVNIFEKNEFTLTDTKGSFSITATLSDILLFSLEGYQNVQLQVQTDPMLIEMVQGRGEQGDVVELPYRTELRQNVLAATSTAKGRVLEKQPVTFLDLALAGTMSGLAVRENRSEPGWNYYLFSYIRGLRTFGSQGSATGFGGEGDDGNANRPLYIVDNVERDLTTMDAYSIENITVLKDLASTAVYGQRGANGVVLVTTRRGQAGRTRISLNQEFAFQSILKRPTFENSAEYAETMNRATELDGSTVMPYTQEDIDLFRSGESPWTHPNTDWYGLVIRDYAPQYRTNLNISGGNNTARYFVSMTYTKQESIYNKRWTRFNDEWSTDHTLDRWNFRSNIDVNVNKNLNVSLDLGGRLDIINQPATINEGGVWQIFTIASENHADWLAINPDGSWAAGFPNATWGANHRNPLAKIAEWGYEQNFKRSIYTNVRANHKLDFITKGLTAKMLIAFDSYNSFWIERSQRPAFYRYNPADSSYALIAAASPLTLNRSSARDMLYTTNMNYMLDYNRTFGNHAVSAQAMYRQIILNKVGMTARWSNLAFIGRVNYAYKNKYLLESSITRMGIDNYLKGERFGTFPSVSAGWIVSNEDFLKDNDLLTFLKLRVSHGLAGNDRTRARRYPYTDIYGTGTGYTFGGEGGTSYGGYVESQAGNRLIKWETAEMTNVGLDISLWNDAFYANLDLFQEQRGGILTDRNSIPSIYGMNPPLDPFGRTSSKGGELAIGTRAKAGQVHFNIELTTSLARSTIIEMDEVAPPEEYMTLTGYPIGQIIGYRFDKFFETYDEIANSPIQELGTTNLKPGNIKWKDLNNDGVVNANDRERFGYPEVPQRLLGANIGIAYRGFEIFALFYGEFERTVEMPRNMVHGLQWGGQTTPEVRKSWGYYSEDPEHPTNKEALYPRISANTTRYANDILDGQVSDYWFRNGNFIRLRNLEIAYNLPSSLTQKANISNLRIFANGYNLMAWDNINILDAETPNNFLWGYPKQKAFSVGFNLTF
jgi:TonB-linked SusC/RagA family outer membrane protein